MVYIELLVIQDLFMNFLVILTTGILLNRITKFKKVFLAAVIGTISIPLIFIEINKILLLILMFVFAIIMSIIAFNHKGIIYTAKNIMYMYLSSVFLAGSLYFININFLPHINNYILNTIILLTISPIVIYIYVKSIKKLKNNYSNYYKIDIYLKDKPKITVNAFLDTGNMLQDPYSHKPIILIAKDKINLTNEKTILVPYHTIDNESMIKCFAPEKIYIDKVGCRKRVLIGLIKEVNIEDADCILNKRLLERI